MQAAYGCFVHSPFWDDYLAAFKIWEIGSVARRNVHFRLSRTERKVKEEMDVSTMQTDLFC